VLSLFDGISILQLALQQSDISVNNYYASEIDKNCIKVTRHHFPNTIQLGDVRDLDGHSLPDIDLMAFGSPCQNLSSLRKNRQGLDSEDSGLFFEALRLLQEVRPRYFLMENVGSMSKHDRRVITGLLGVEPIRINSSLVGPALRDRCYWTNIKGITVPVDRNVQLKDVIDSGYVDRTKSNAIITKNVPHTKSGLVRYLSKGIGQVVFHDRDFAELPKRDKLDRIQSMGEDEAKLLFRLFTIRELERLQGYPTGYVGGILKKTPSHHAIGNGFTLETIKHILSFADFGP